MASSPSKMVQSDRGNGRLSWKWRLVNLAAAQHRLESSLDALLLRLPRQLGHLYPSSSLQSPLSLPPRLTTASSSSAQPPPPPTTAPTSVAPMAPLPIPRFHLTNRHFQLSRLLPLLIRPTHRRYLHGHCPKTPYSNDTILLDDDAVKHQIDCTCIVTPYGYMIKNDSIVR